MPNPLLEVTFLRDIRAGGHVNQPQQVANDLAAFIAAAQHTLHIAIYDFRLSDALALIVVPEIKKAAERGVDVKIAYDHQKPAKQPVDTVGSDPKPRGTHIFVPTVFADSPKVHIEAIVSSALMHSKYVLRDSQTPQAAVWTGSANFTDDAWTYQENNILKLHSPELAQHYETDFAQLWQAGTVAHTGKNDGGTVTIGGRTVEVAFSPGDGTIIGKDLAAWAGAAQRRLLVASMVLTSAAVLGALDENVQQHAGMLKGIYDGTQMAGILKNKKHPMNAAKTTLFKAVAAKLAAKVSTPFSNTSRHDFMHNKTLVSDDVVVTGSFNFSERAASNAENVLVIHDKATADAYARYVSSVVKTYTAKPKP